MPVLERGAGRTRRTGPFFAVALGLGLPTLAAIAVDSVWDGHYLLIPATWLVAGVLVAALLGGTLSGVVAAATATALHAWTFVPPTRSFRVSRGADGVATITFAIMAFGVTAALDQLARARRRADRSYASLDALLVHAPVGIAFLDRDLRFVRANAALGDIAGRSVDEHVGRTLDEVTGRTELAAIVRNVLDTGEPVVDVAISGRDRDGRPFHVVAGYYPVPGPKGEIEGVGVVVRDVTDVLAADRERERLISRVTRLQQITAVLAAARTTEDVTRAVLEDVRLAVGADAASLCSLVDDEIEIIAASGYADDTLQARTRFPLAEGTPFAEAIREGRVIIASTLDEIAARWPRLSSWTAPGRQAIVAMPLLAGSVAHGTVGLSFDRAIDIENGDEGFLTAVATQCAEAFLRARLFESEQAAHAASETAGARLTFLAEASNALAQSLDWAATLHQVAQLAVPHLADLAAVFVVEGDTVAALDIVDLDPVRQAAVRRIAERWPARLDQDVGIGAVARTGEPILVNDLRPEQLRTANRSQEHAAAIVDAGYQSILVVPMRANEQIVGIVVLATTAPRRLTDDDLALASELATRAGQAIVNAELFRDRSRVAATLQASLLPPATPTVPGLEVATRFFAIGEGIDVGGDFYDVFRMGTRADPEDRWVVVIGDVRGKGTEAASISGAARHAIRTAALHQTSPAAMLHLLNELLLAMAAEDDDEPRFCTAVVAVVEPNPDGARIVLSVGGHPPPMVLRADGRTE
ncbi:MAG: hypothetical protein JWO68_3949, partial [Actinomycetia bacterium]|nr:hypothetical protein [Actinomycetes bacterium]